MDRARAREIAGYRERHHVLPRCMGGGDSKENLVALTPEEHYVAHQLLVKLHPDKHQLAFAALRMARGATGNKAFGWLRRRVSQARLGKPLSAEHRAKVGAAGRGRKHSEESKAKMRAVKIGKRKHMTEAGRRTLAEKVKSMSSEAHKRQADAIRGRKASAETRGKLSAARIGNQHSRGFKHSEETRAKMGAAKRAWWSLPETKQRMANAHKKERQKTE